MAQLTADQRIALLESRLRVHGILFTFILVLLLSALLGLWFMSRSIGWPQPGVVLRADTVLTKQLIVSDESDEVTLVVTSAKGGGTMNLYGSQGKPAMIITSYDPGGGKITLYDREGKETFSVPEQQ